MKNKIIEVLNLAKTFELKKRNSKIKALDDISFSVNDGEIFGLLGPNGAGKTTTIQILTTLLTPTSGKAFVDGYNVLEQPLKAKSRIALMLGSHMLYFRITGYENLKFFCKIYKVPHDRQRIYDHAKEFGLENWLDEYVEKYSSGMKTKLALCRTFLLDRPIMFLDEPTIGLDAKLKSFVINKLKDIKSTILLTSHDMGVVEKLCDRIAFINKGKILKIGTQDEIKKIFGSGIKFEIKITENKGQLIKELDQEEYIKKISDLNKGILVNFQNRENLGKLLSILGRYKVLKVKEQEVNLEDVFIKYA